MAKRNNSQVLDEVAIKLRKMKQQEDQFDEEDDYYSEELEPVFKLDCYCEPKCQSMVVVADVINMFDIQLSTLDEEQYDLLDKWYTKVMELIIQKKLRPGVTNVTVYVQKL